MSVLIIAEAGVNHNGDMSLAKQLVDMAVRCGADAIKFQTFKARDCVNQLEDKVGYQKANDKRQETQYEMLKRLELGESDFIELSSYCREKNIMFLSTPFGEEPLDFLMKLDMPLIKLSSTEVTNHPFLQKVARYNKPIILSTGMSYLEEVQEALEVLQNEGNPQVTILHCTTDYPTMLEDANIRAMKTMGDKMGVPVGYSDHTLDEVSAVAAVALGATVIEKHITLDRDMEGPDHKASMEEAEFLKYIHTIRKIEKVLGSGVKQPTERENSMREAVRRSIVAKVPIVKGTIIEEGMLTYKRPGTGIAPKFAKDLIGRMILRDMMVDEMFSFKDIEEV